MPHLAAQWARIRVRLQTEVGEAEYRTWLRQMALSGTDGDEVTVTLPTRFLRDWVTSRYGDRIKALWQAENPAVRRVDVRVSSITATPIPLTESLSAPSEDVHFETPHSDAPQADAPYPDRRRHEPPRKAASGGSSPRDSAAPPRADRFGRADAPAATVASPPATAVASPNPPFAGQSSQSNWSEDRGRPASGTGRSARSALHLRRFRRRQAQRVRLCLCARRVAERPVQSRVQSAVPLRRGGPGQDPSDARHGVGADRPRPATPCRSPTCRPRSSCIASSPRSAANRPWSSRRTLAQR